MKIKVSEASGVVLDWMAAKCEGMKPYWDENREDFAFSPHVYLCWLSEFKPSTNWAQGGPIIEREGIALRKYGDFAETRWQADKWQFRFAGTKACGSTPLIAAMRCFCMSRLGEEAEVPEELVLNLKD